jgi:hypothetical protein
MDKKSKLVDAKNEQLVKHVSTQVVANCFFLMFSITSTDKAICDFHFKKIFFSNRIYDGFSDI